MESHSKKAVKSLTVARNKKALPFEDHSPTPTQSQNKHLQ